MLFEAILQQTREEVKAWGGEFVIAYLPTWGRYKNPDDYTIEHRSHYKYRKEVLNIIKKNNIPLVDLHPVFQKQNDVFSLFHFGLHGHYNKNGAQLVAEEVRKGLKSLSQ